MNVVPKWSNLEQMPQVEALAHYKVKARSVKRSAALKRRESDDRAINSIKRSRGISVETSVLPSDDVPRSATAASSTDTNGSSAPFAFDFARFVDTLLDGQPIIDDQSFSIDCAQTQQPVMPAIVPQQVLAKPSSRKRILSRAPGIVLDPSKRRASVSLPVYVRTPVPCPSSTVPAKGSDHENLHQDLPFKAEEGLMSPDPLDNPSAQCAELFNGFSQPPPDQAFVNPSGRPLEPALGVKRKR